MENLVLFDVAEGTQNLGDYIIMQCIMEEMGFYFNNKYLTHFSTHTPIARCYQNFRRNMMSRACDNSKNKFICGANTIKESLLRISPDWNINIFNIKYYKDSITIGVGMDMNAKNMDFYTKYIYSKIFSKKFIHSTRDNRTMETFKKLGYKAINTGCPTTWKLTEEFCKSIPTKKSDDVIFTLTFYDKDRKNDQKLIDILKENYKKIYFWVQGSEDYEYFNSFENINGIELINPNLQAYEDILNKKNIDYVGTRLHAGIYALRHKVRSIIISIDNRARDMSKTYSLNTIERNNIEMLSKMINSEFETNVKINTKAIEEWKSQFREEKHE
ncbi:MAG TPA: hypothetical protein DHV70_04990 [Firmicutes bacterium]|nr:hypothetical protein [Bacillota bacterium]